MDIFLQTAALVSDPPGSLVYHLVLLFALLVATGLALSQRQARLAFGAGGIFTLRLITFVVSFLATASILDPLIAIPPLERAASTLTLLLIIWMVAFPQPARPADAALAGLILICLIALGISWNLWAQEVAAGARFYNATNQETGWEIAQLALLAAGLILLTVRRPSNWLLGFGLLTILLAGHAIHTFFFTVGNASVSGVERLAEILALPMLAALVFRRVQALAGEPTPRAPTTPPSPIVAPQAAPASRAITPEPPSTRPVIDSKAAVALASLGAADSSEELAQIITLALAHTFHADACLLIRPANGAETARIVCGYDRAREQFLPGRELPLGEMPSVAAALNRATSSWLMPGRQAAELRRLVEAAGFTPATPSPVRLVALATEAGQVLGVVALVSAQPELTPEEQSLLTALIESVATALGATEKTARLERDLEQQRAQAELAAETLRAAQAEAERLTRELDSHAAELEEQRLEAEKLTNQLRAQQQTEASQIGMLGELHTLRGQWQEAQRAAEEQERLEAELAEAQERIAALAPLEAQLQGLTRQVEEGQQQESQLLKELDLTRAELTRMAEAYQAAQTPQAEPSALAAAESALADAQAELAAQAETLAALRERLAGSERQLAEAKIKDRADMEVIASLTQELRQPMSSITGYADLLLSESVGIIGALQRKFLERIKASTERMGALLDDLLNVTTINVGELRLEHESLDVAEVVEEAVQSCATQFREKELTLRMDMPEDLPRLNADRDALRQILTHLLNNASSASAVNSEVLLTVQHEVERPRIGDPAHYLFISMSDTGGGIAPEDQPRVFSRLYRADAPLVAGVGDTGVGLSMVKALVEAHGGRVWVISEQGVGSTFYVLMPLEHSPAKPNNNGSAPSP